MIDEFSPIAAEPNDEGAAAEAPARTGRLLIVSNRLPVTARLESDRVRLRSASGGLATGLRGWHSHTDGLWIGWPGDVSRFSADQHLELGRMLEKRRIVPIHLSADEIERYYEGFANGVLWPVFHYLIDRVPVEEHGWDAYRQVNQRFADTIAEHYQPGDRVWIHDYQLMLVPGLLRERLPDARIGFFLHIPFPSSEVFRTLPWRRELLRGLLGADVVGFHTFAYMRHFVTCLLHIDGIEAEVDSVPLADRRVRLGVFPMSIDSGAFEALGQDPKVRAAAKAIRDGASGRRILVGIDRLDYTKGIPRRLLAVERLLLRRPELRDTIRYIQIAVPSRGMVDSYKAFRRQVEETVGRINGSCGTLASTPVHYMHCSLPRHELAALYCAADVMLVTPLRDGMNLVAKEFLATRVDDEGVLVLSEFAGAAAELGDAVVVNPYDVDATADAIQQALDMPQLERRDRMRRLRRHVMTHDVQHWAASFVGALEGHGDAPPAPLDTLLVRQLVEHLRRAPRLTVLLDYDGTLVPLAATPEQASPDVELLGLLTKLAEHPTTDVHLVSGRPREWLTEWFGDLPLELWAEHGFWHRGSSAEPWRACASVPTEWMKKVLPILEQFWVATPGALIEVKSASIAWHYRQVQPEFGARQAHELRMLLGDALSNQPLEVLEGHKVIEVRLRGVTKAMVAQDLAGDHRPASAILAIGDDRTDEDLFAALPRGAVTITVGTGVSRARYRLADPYAVRSLLQSLAA